MAGKEKREDVEARAGLGWRKRMTSTLTPWLRGVSSTFLQDVRYQQRNNYFHAQGSIFRKLSTTKTVFMDVACDTLDAASRDSVAPVILLLLIYVLEAHFEQLLLSSKKHNESFIIQLSLLIKSGNLFAFSFPIIS